MTQLLMGSDPEFMLVDNKGVLRSAIGVVKGTKTEKVDLGNGNLLFYDNVLAEVNIRPGNSADAFVANVHKCLNSLKQAVYPLRLHLQESGSYPKEECQHPDAQVFGCEPEFCAYEMNMVQAPTCESTLRSAGGHIHLGYASEAYPLLAKVTNEDRMERDWGRVWVIRMMDLFMGIPSLWLDQDPTGVTRRKLYGKAGTHRPKEEYGVEYRATGNFWLRSPDMVRLTYRIADFVVKFVKEKGHLKLWDVNAETGEEACTAYDVEVLKDSINNTNKDKAKTILNGVVKQYMPADLYQQVLIACEPPAQANFLSEWGIN